MPKGPAAVIAGSLFGADGTVMSADLATPLGMCASSGLPVPLPEQNLVVYVDRDWYGYISAIAFETSTYRPLAFFSMRTKDINKKFIDAVRTGHDSLAFTDGDEIFLLPLSAMISWPTPDASITEVAPGIQQINLPASAIAAGPDNQLLIATPSIDGVTIPGVAKTLTLRVFDAASLAPVETREIKVTATDKNSVSRLIPCGDGRLAFAAGNEIYIIDPDSAVLSAGSSVILFLSESGAVSAATGGSLGATQAGYATVRVNSGTNPYATDLKHASGGT